MRYNRAVIKSTYASQDEIPEALREHYVERDGTWQIDVDGSDTPALKRALEHERAERRRVNQEREQLRTKISELEEQRDAAAAKNTPADDAQAAAFQRRIEALEKLVQAEQQKAAQAEQRLAEQRITDTLRQAALDIGVEPTLVDDIISLPRIRSAWRIGETGDPVAYDGEQMRYSQRDPSRSMPAAEFLQTILKDNRSYFKPTNGAGTVPSPAPVRASGKVQISVADARDHQKWLRAKEAAVKAGQDGPVIVDQ
jgi:hypothetical protein